MPTLTLALLGTLIAGTPSQAKGIDDDCLRTRVWDTYGEGWSVRTASDAELGFGRTAFYKVSLLKGRAYRVLSCSEESVKNLDILLYDKDGQVLSRDDSANGSPMLAFTPTRTGVYYVVLYLRDAESRDGTRRTSWALVHNDP